MNVGSLFTGIGGFDLGLERAGHRIVFQCEKDAYRRGVLARHWPRVPCFEDVRLVSREHGGRPAAVQSKRPIAERREPQCSVDLLCGGFPCQDLSVAGRRAGLAGERSGLFFEFARVADAVLGPGGWLLIENVPGLLSSNGGRDFAVLFATLADIGFHDLAWRVLDSRHFGVPQRRRRVYIVGRRAAGDRARAVLLEPESGGGDFAPSREARARVAASLTSGSHGAGVNEPGRRKEDDENIVSGPLTGRYRKGINSSVDDGAAVVGPLVSRSSRGNPQTLSAGGIGPEETLLAGTVRSHQRPGSNASTDILCPPPDPNGVRAASGLPGRVDDPQPDGPRYSACGDAVTVNVAEWIGRRLMEFA